MIKTLFDLIGVIFAVAIIFGSGTEIVNVASSLKDNAGPAVAQIGQYLENASVGK